ncbi:MAG: penicillin acylase family protein, partial [Anaerolineales bacterium]|nr:penicillin acylase family protein [Anaerolineales bacterium]
AHAEDDFDTIQLALAAARGQLGPIGGPDLAPNDFLVQLLRIPEVVSAGYPTLAPETRALVEGYADGLNHYAALHADEAYPGLFPITGQDVVAGFVHKTPFFFGVEEVIGSLFGEERPLPVATKEAASQLPATVRYGSNTFAVSPARSANGETFLAVNSHQPWTGPVAWYEAHVHSEEGWNTVGGLFPGAPVVLVGHNENLGWAFTVNSPDLVDVYVLDINPDNPNQYRFDGEWRDLEVRSVPIKVKIMGRLTWTVHEEALWSVYGPTVRQPHGVYAIRYAGYGEVGLVEQWYRMNKATTFEEWQTAMREGVLPMFNAGYADKEGNIYYLYNALLPIRAAGYDWQQFLPGDTSETLWTEYLPFDQLPQVLNPASGFIQNGNSSPFQTTIGAENPDPADYAPTLGIETGMSNRALRALELFGADESITAEDFYTYKFDMAYSADSDIPRYVDIIVNAPELQNEDTAVQQAMALLQDWDLRTDPDSRAAALMILTLNYVNDNGHINPSKLVGADIDPELVVAGFQAAVASLQEHFGRVDVPWSEVNRLVRGDTDLGLGGAPDVLHAVYGELGEDGRFQGIAGDSYIMLVSWDAAGQVSSQSIHQFGSATLDDTSPHYADQAPLFVNRELKPVWLDEADIRAHLEREYRPGEE